MGLNTSAFEARVAAGARVLIDTSILIAYFEQNDSTHTLATFLIDDCVRNGRNPAIVSTVTAMEVLVRPLRAAPRGAIHVHAFLTQWPNLTLMNVDLHVAQEGASLRAHHAFKVPDALVIASGIVGQVGHLITNDRQWRKKLAPIAARIEVTELRDYT